MNLKIYVDESGNTGESLVYKNKFFFGAQPYFCLVGVILPIEKKRIETELLSLCKKFNIHMQELKANRIIKKKPKFFEDYFDILDKLDIPVFIEFMDKKYYVIANMINSLIFPCNEFPPEINGDYKMFRARRILANKLHKIISKNSYEKFSTLCLNENETNFNNAINSIVIDIIRSRDSDLASVLMHLKKTHESISDIYACEPKKNHLKHHYRPLPDQGTKRDLYLMPHVSSVFNIVPRFQHYAESISAKSISIIHDEQSHYDDTLKNTLKEVYEHTDKKGTEILKRMSEAILFSKNIDGYEQGFDRPNVSYDIPKKSIAISFQISKQELGIQMADLVAGFMTQTWMYFQKNRKLPSYAVKPYQHIFRMWEQEASIGCNFVVPDRHYDRVSRLI